MMQPAVDKALLGGTFVSQLLGGTASRLAGGLNLLSAGDQLNAGECITSSNWRTDQAGMLRSRGGMAPVQTLAGYIHTITTVQAVAGNRRYYGADDQLYRAGVSIDTGYDGNPLGTVSFQNRLWVINPNHQRKDDGANYWAWTPAAAIAAPTAAIPVVSTPGAPHGGGTGQLRGTYHYYIVGSVPGTGATTTPVGPLIATFPYFSALDFNSITWTCPAFADPAVTQWNLYRNSDQGIAVDGNPGNVAYLVNAAPLAIAATYLDDGAGGNLQSFIVGRGITITLTQTSLFGGANTYYVTGVTDLGEESNPSPALAVTIDPRGVTITRPAFADPQITKWNLYRSGGANSLPSYLVNPTPIALATTTFVDRGANDTASGGINTTDAGLVALGTLMRTDRTPAPPASGLAGPYFGKLLAFNSAAHPNRIWWTPSDEPSVFPGANSEQDGNWVDVGEEGEPVRAIAVFPRWVAILKGQTIYRMVGDPDDWGTDIERTNAEVGLMGSKAWAVAGSTVFLQAEEGAYAFTGDAATKISPQFDPIFKGDGVALPGAFPTAAVSATRKKNCMAYRNGRLYFSYADGANTSPNVTAVWEGGRWVTDTRGFTALYYEGQGGSLLGAIGSTVYALGAGDTDNGAPIPITYQSRYEDQGAPENDKRYADVLIDHNAGGHTFNVWAYLENGTANIFLGTITSTTRQQTTFVIGDSEYRNISIRLESTDAGTAHAEIYAIAVHYLPLERNARTYDSEKIALERLSLLNAIELNLEILSGSVTYAFSTGTTDLHQVSTGTLSGGIQSFPIVLPDATTGHWVRLILSGDNYRCHGARLQLQPISPEGVTGPPQMHALLEGAQPGPGQFLNSRTYDTGRVPLGKVSLLETLEVELEILSGTVAYTFYDGLTALENTTPGTFGGAGAARTFRIPVPQIEARWIRLVLTGSDYRCHGARLLLQPYGLYLTGVGDTFRSGDLTLGSPRIKLLQQVRVDCDPDGTIPGTFLSDVPGALAQRQVLSLTATAGRSWQRQNLPRDTRGRVLRIEFTAPAVCRIYAIQVRAKVLGEGSSSWQWLDVPVEPTQPGFAWMPIGIE